MVTLIELIKAFKLKILNSQALYRLGLVLYALPVISRVVCFVFLLNGYPYIM